MKKIYHYYNKLTGEHSYYSALAALFIDQEGATAVSKFTLDRFDWGKYFENEYENDIVIIRRGVLHTTSEMRKKNDLPNAEDIEPFNH